MESSRLCCGTEQYCWGSTARCRAADTEGSTTHAGDWWSKRGCDGGVPRSSECQGSVTAVELGARRDSAGKASTGCVECREGERQTQHTEWLDGRQHPPRVERRGGCEEMSRASRDGAVEGTLLIARKVIDAGRRQGGSAVLPIAMPDAAVGAAAICCDDCARSAAGLPVDEGRESARRAAGL